MWLIRKRAYARAGLVGNPSDGYFGKTVSLIIPENQRQSSCPSGRPTGLIFKVYNKEQKGSGEK